MFIAVPLRTQTILRENLRFPSGTATAKVIRTLHGLPEDDASFGRSRVAASPRHAQRGAPELAAVGPLWGFCLPGLLPDCLSCLSFLVQMVWQSASWAGFSVKFGGNMLGKS